MAGGNKLFDVDLYASRRLPATKFLNAHQAAYATAYVIRLRFRWRSSGCSRFVLGKGLCASTNAHMPRSMDSLFDSLRAELERLEDEIREDPRLLKIARIKDLMQLYQHTGNAAHANQRQDAREQELIDRSAPDVSTINQGGGPGKNPRSKAYQVKQRVRELIESHGKIHRSNILQELVHDGLMGQEKNPISSLAAYLSEWRSEFVSDGRGSFSLANPASRAPKENGLEGHPSSPPGVSLF